MKLANLTADTKYWTARPLPQKRVCSIFDMDRETEIADENTQNSGRSFVFLEKNFLDPRFMFCANVSHVICKILGNFQGKVGGEFTCIRRRISPAGLRFRYYLPSSRRSIDTDFKSISYGYQVGLFK